jgi:hypothetical protein
MGGGELTMHRSGCVAAQLGRRARVDCTQLIYGKNAVQRPKMMLACQVGGSCWWGRGLPG